MTRDPSNGQKSKKPYKKPKLSRVPLQPDEAVLGNCKSVSTAGPVAANCSTPVVCSAFGS